MKKLIVAGALLLVAIVIYSFVSGNKEAVNNKTSISFYKVPLVCSAAPEIGCGSKSKPVLLGLEKKNNVVSEAWLNRAGTVIAIVWNENSSSELRTTTANAVFKENKLDVAEVKGKEYKKMLADFQEKKNWYLGTEVDKLSMEEAGVIAERLTNRINDIVVNNDKAPPLTGEKNQNLKKGFADVFKKRFSKNYGSEINSDEKNVVQKFKTETENELLEVGKKYLNEKKMKALKDAITLGLRPIESENKNSKGCCSKTSSN